MEEKMYEILETVGMNGQEAETYIGLVKKKFATANDLAKTLGKHRSNVYETLRILQQKGFVTESISGTKRFFHAKDPSYLLEYLNQKHEELHHAVEVLNELKNTTKDMESVSLESGTLNARVLLSTILDLNDEVYLWDFPTNITEILGEAFVEEKVRERLKKKVPLKIIAVGVSPLLLKLSLEPKTQIRASKNPNAPAFTIICADRVFILPFLSSTTIIQIKNKKVADWFRQNFLALWETLEKLKK